jgi:iron complex outermembrane receptor protein
MKTFGNKKTMALAIVAAQIAIFDSPMTFAQAMLEEVIVTARKREETLMDAPLSVTAVNGDSMDKQGITNMEQLSAKVPGLQIGRGAQTNSIFIRGIGSGVNKAFEQSAGMYVDGIYQSRGRQFTQSMVDVQQVEVLRGPQGTLFGKNTIAGAIKVETATTLPGDELNGSLTLDHEWGYNTTRGTAIIGGSPTENIGARLAIRYQESDGYMENNTLNRDVAEKEDTVARLSLAWDVTDNFRAVGKVSYVDMEGLGVEVVNPVVDSSLLGDFQAGNSQLGVVAVAGTIAALAVPGYEAATGSKEYDSWSASPRYNDGDTESTESTSVSLKLEWDVGEYTVTALTGYSDFDFKQDHDTDFHGGNVAHNIDEESLQLFSQEIRIASDYDGRFNFIAGAYYEDQDLDAFGQPFLDGSLGGVFGTLPAGAFNPALAGFTLGQLGINSLWNGALLAPDTPLAGTEITDIWRKAEMDQTTETRAIFGEVSFDLTDALTLEVGLRYSEDSKELRKQGSIGIGAPSNPITTVNSDGTSAGADPLQSALNSAIWGGLLATYPHDQKLKREEDHLDPAVRLRWEATDDTMVYLSWSEGYKSGGYNASADSANPDGSPGTGTEYEDEAAEAWELGVKTTAWDGRARLTGTLFRTEITDLQVTSFQGLTFKVGNAAEMVSQGIEFETQIAMTEELELGASIAYLDHEFESYTGAPATINQQAQGISAQDLSGHRGPYAPEWSGTLYADYSRHVGQNWLLSARADVNFKDDFHTDGDLDPNSLQDAYIKVDARLALATLDGRWEVSLYGRNLTDEATLTASLDSPLSAGIMASWIEEPRVLGLQVRYGF